MPDLSTPEEIRAEVIEVLARWAHMLTRAKYPDCVVPPWEDDSEERREAHRAAVSGYADALAAAGLLVTAVEGRYIGRGLLRRTRYVTDWREPEETE